MKIQTIGDIHGRSYWPELIDDSSDKIIFIGDYVDNFVYTDDQILTNLLSIIDFKKRNQDKVVLLLGNHDVAYLQFTYQMSGFRHSMYETLLGVFNDNLNLFQIAYQHGKHLWTHAGVTQDFYMNVTEMHSIKDTIADTLNNAWCEYPRMFNHPGEINGSEGLACCIWERPFMLERHGLQDVVHIVGHTASNEIIHKKLFGVEYYRIDVLKEDKSKLPMQSTLILELS